MGVPSPSLAERPIDTEIRDPESQLLISMLAARFGGERPAPIAPVNWSRFLTLLRQHRIARLVRTEILEAIAPPDVAAAVGDIRRDAALQALAIVAETVRLAAAFRDEHIEMVALKGVVFAQQFHSDPLARASRDIDVLIEAERLEDARRVLERLGYSAPEPILRAGQNAMEFRAAGASVPIEVHVELHDSPEVLRTDAVWDNRLAVEIPLPGGSAPALAPEFALSYAAVHASKHFWRRLLWLSDIAAAMRSERIDWQSAWAFAEHYRTERYLALALALARSVLGIELPAALPLGAPAFRRARQQAGWLAPTIAASLLNGDSEAVRQLGVWRSLRLQVGLPKGFAATTGTLRQIFRPTPDDLACITLPSGFRWAHYPLRVIRLARKYRLAPEAKRQCR